MLKNVHNVEESQKETIITRSPEITYGIRNFVGNAVKYSKSEVNISLKVDRYKVKLIISDNGPGFSNEVLGNIGKPYIGSESAVLKEKSGLGLGTFIGQTLLERKKAQMLACGQHQRTFRWEEEAKRKEKRGKEKR